MTPLFARLMVGLAIIITSQTAIAEAQSPQPAGQQLLKAEELDQLVSPIALYTDTLLAEVLMASTYPLEIVQADRWATTNKKLKGDQLKAAVDKQSWDESVKSLVATPSVLAMMSAQLDWTQKLGDAVLAQQSDVMDAIQRLRAKAQANNKLPSGKEQKVASRQEQNREVISIEPAEPDQIYVPYYDPAVVYGAWPYSDYPPYYFPAPAYVARAAIAAGIAFGVGYAVGRWASGDYRWGGGIRWGDNNINVNRPVNINNPGINNWSHNPAHRHGVRYGNADVAKKYAKGDIGAADKRIDYRGRQPASRPGDGAGPGDRRPGDARPGDRRPGDARPKDRRPGADRPAKARPKGPSRDSGFAQQVPKKVAHAQAERGRDSLGDRGAGRPVGARPAGGGRPMGGGRGGGGRGGGRR